MKSGRDQNTAPAASHEEMAGDCEAVLRANNCPYALTASIFFRDETAEREFAARSNVLGKLLKSIFNRTRSNSSEKEL